MSLAKKLLNNPGLIALTVDEEKKEILSAVRPRKIKFAFFQTDLSGTKIPFWHVDYKSPSEFGTTLSLKGLKQWGYL